MLVCSSTHIRRFSFYLSSSYPKVSEIVDTYGITTPIEEEPKLLKALFNGLKRMPPRLVRDCGVTKVKFDDLGPSKEYFPNHGVYRDGAFVINKQILDHPYLKEDASGSTMDKFEETLFHELGHGFDEIKGGDLELSLQPEWLSLSGWSMKPKPGLKRIIIREKGSPELAGEWCYDPSAGFTRFYAKRNPWDDFADSFAYYVGGCKSFLPNNKIEYFDKLTSNYYD